MFRHRGRPASAMAAEEEEGLKWRCQKKAMFCGRAEKRAAESPDLLVQGYETNRMGESASASR